MALSIDQFINEIAASGLVPAAELLAWLSAIPEANRPRSGEELARELVQQRKLTNFQAEQLYAGQGRSLTLGNYLILDKLGQGGMGIVLKAMHRRMERIVALKVMSQAGMKSPDAVQRFHREVKAAAKLHHPNIVTAFDADESNGTHFLVMEYVEGTNLSALVKEHGPLPIEQAVLYILQAARGLEYAHSRGVIHRDIKPSNLLVCSSAFRRPVGTLPPEGGTTNVKILDMGLARIDAVGDAQAELTTTGAVMGTVDYMAPEQALSAKSADARSDIYSLGISLWYLLTGRVAYDGDSMMAKLLAHRDMAIPSLAEELRRVGRGTRPTNEPTAHAGGSRGLDPLYEAVDSVFRKMVAKQPKDRYQSMTEVIVDLERCLTGTAPVAASQPISGARSAGGSASGTTTGSLETAVSRSTAEAETIVLSAVDGGTNPRSELSLTLEGTRLQSPASAGRASKRRLALFGSIAAAVVALLAIVFSRNDQPDQRLGQNESTSTNQRASELNAVGSDKSPTAVATDGFQTTTVKPPLAKAPFNETAARAHQEAWAKHLGMTIETTNTVGTKMILIPPGEFLMGSTDEQIAAVMKEVAAVHGQELADRIRNSEQPQHRVVVTKPFLMGASEVTLGQFKKFIAATERQTYGESQVKDASSRTYLRPGYLVTDDSPVSLVTWDEAVAYCNWLSDLEQSIYRLPTEAEWEYACRAGTESLWSWGDARTQSIKYAWTIKNSEMRPHPVATKLPNPFGLFDMHGNVSEWCQDRFDETWYANSPSEDPIGSSGNAHTQSVRGGTWDYNSIERSAYRTGLTHHVYDYTIGFRVVREID